MALPRAWGPKPIAPPKPKKPTGATPRARTTIKPRPAKPNGPAAGAGAGMGLPTIEDEKVTRARANAQAWKMIEQQMSGLPSFQAFDAPYTAQRAAIQPMVDAHRDWLMNAGQYMTQMSNGIAQAAYGAGSAGDAAQGGFAALAGAAPGSLPSTNVTPGALSSVPTAQGVSTANYLQSLVPFATALGIGNVGRINADEQAGLTQLGEQRAEVSRQFPDVADKLFTSSRSSIFDEYKSELAALAAGGKASVDRGRAGETARHNKEMERLRARGYDIQASKSSTATIAAADKAASALSKEQRGITQKAIAEARKTYDRLGGVKGTPTSGGGGQFQSTIELTYPPDVTGKKPASAKHTVYGSSVADVRAKIGAYIKGHPALKIKDAQGNVLEEKSGHWNLPGIKTVPGTSGSGSAAGVKDRPSESTRRLRAWRTFKAQLAAGGVDMSTAEMQSLFRTQFGDPAR